MGDDRNQCRSRAESDGKEKEVSPFVAPFLNNQLKYSQISDRERFGKTELWATTEFVGKTKSGPVRLCNCQLQRNTGGTHESRNFVSSQMVGGGRDGVGRGREELSLDLPLIKEGDLIKSNLTCCGENLRTPG